jgi:hypothetical protein
VTVDLEAQLREDRVLRDAARALFRADVSHVRADLTSRGIGARLVDRLGEGAADVFEEAMEVADSHKGALATLVAAIVLWFARNPIIALFTGDEDTEGDSEQAPCEGR